MLFLAQVHALDDEAAFSLTDLENRARADVSDLKRARNYAAALAQHYGGRQARMAERPSISEGWLSKMIALAAIPDEVVAAFPSPADLQLKRAYPLAQALEDTKRYRLVQSAARRFAKAQDQRRAHGQPLMAAPEVMRELLNAHREQFTPDSPHLAHSLYGRPMLTVAADGRQGLTVKLHAGSGTSDEEIVAEVRRMLEHLREHEGVVLSCKSFPGEIFVSPPSPAPPPVAVEEGVDGLELDVDQPGADKCGPKSAAKLDRGMIQPENWPTLEDWVSGDQVWLVDPIAPSATAENKHRELMLADLIYKPLGGSAFKLHRANPPTGEQTVQTVSEDAGTKLREAIEQAAAADGTRHQTRCRENSRLREAVKPRLLGHAERRLPFPKHFLATPPTSSRAELSFGSRAMLVGYARVSTRDQNPQAQVDALTATGCERVFHRAGVG